MALIKLVPTALHVPTLLLLDLTDLESFDSSGVYETGMEEREETTD